MFVESIDYAYYILFVIEWKKIIIKGKGRYNADSGNEETIGEVERLHSTKIKPISSSSAHISLDLLANLGSSPITSGSNNTQPLDHIDLKQLEMDKKAVYSHPLFPLLALIFEKCEIATRSINAFDTDPSLQSSTFNNEIEEFIEHQQKMGKPFLTNNSEVDTLMIRSIQVFRIHLLELEKVSDLCKDFCQRYTCNQHGSSHHSKRGVLPKQATSIMRSWLFQHIVHPYPTEDEKRAIASQTNLTLLQVNNWFINARRRILQPMLDSANTIHHELVANNNNNNNNNHHEFQELDLSASKVTNNKSNNKHNSKTSSKRLKTSTTSSINNQTHTINRFWPQSLANILQNNDLNRK
ncbi:Homeobox protein pknox2 [Blomia tropicalis]|nr:Homeobox protein pknox2 [Blomia tropicalis]